MPEIEFEWDPQKDRSNQKKHGVSFDEAATAFYDEEALLLDDPDHSENEDHFIILGISSALRLLVVVHCYRGDDATISNHLGPTGCAGRDRLLRESTKAMRTEYDFSKARKESLCEAAQEACNHPPGRADRGLLQATG